jgi:hypothetical protein
MPYIGRPLNAGNLAVQSGTGDGSDTTPIATLDYSVGSSNSIGVYLDGVRQLAGTDFTASGTVLTFTTAPANGVGIDVYFLGLELSIPTPADATVTAAKLASNAVTTAKIVANAVDETKLKDALIADFTEVTVAAGDSILLGDATDSGNTKRDTVQGILDLASSTTNVATVEATYNMTTASGNQDITGFGFNPTHFIIVAGIDNTITSSIGMGDFTSEGCNASRDGSTTMNMQLTLVADVETGAGAAQRANGSSSISDGIRLAWAKSGSPSGTMNIVITGFIK